MIFYCPKHSINFGIIIMLFFTLLNLSAAITESPVEVVRARNNTIKGILEEAGEQIADSTKEKLKDIINGLIDFRELSRRALGKYWEKRSEQEKEDFVNVFRQLIRNSSVKKLEIYRADRIEYNEPVINNDKATVTTIAYKGRKNAEIVYKMHKVKGEWKTYDIVIDGLSTARNYRSSFYKQIAKSSYQEMYDKLAQRLAEKKKD